MEQQKQNQGKEAKKVLEGFEKVMEKLTAIVGGEKQLTPKVSVDKDQTATLVAELFKEEREANSEQIKKDLKDLLKNHVLLNKTLKEERAKLDKLEIVKKKEFNTAANKLFAKIEGMDELVSEYANSFNEAKEGLSES